MSMMAVAVAMAAGVLFLTILVAVFKENRRFFLKLKDFLMDKKVKCIKGNTVFLLKLFNSTIGWRLLCSQWLLASFMYKLYDPL